jgi:signal peptidase II
MRNATRLALLVTIGATIACDRVTKQVAQATLAGSPRLSFLADTVRLEYAENTGGFLGLGGDWSHATRVILLTVATGLLLAVAAGMAFHARLTGSRLVGLTLFVTGGACNWADRMMRGSVTDFLNVGIGSVRTGIFNVADMAIMLGAALLLYSELRMHRRGTYSPDRVT